MIREEYMSPEPEEQPEAAGPQAQPEAAGSQVNRSLASSRNWRNWCGNGRGLRGS